MSAYAKERNARADIKKRNAEAQARYQARHPEKQREMQARWFQATKVARRAKEQERQNEWRRENPDKDKSQRARHYRNQKARYHAAVAKRRAHLLKAIPKWADLDKIKAIYTEAARRNANGEQVHVDHVVPLKHPSVSGLHVETNLEIIPASANWRKNNRHWPDMPS